uniref:Uncharacterized protein n=1 Tax=Dunaliella tertiolecta TaxID=3047 RepID=A0A7S3QMY2_DUNTE
MRTSRQSRDHELTMKCSEHSWATCKTPYLGSLISSSLQKMPKMKLAKQNTHLHEMRQTLQVYDQNTQSISGLGQTAHSYLLVPYQSFNHRAVVLPLALATVHGLYKARHRSFVSSTNSA